jgi:vitamin B12 transporter
MRKNNTYNTSHQQQKTMKALLSLGLLALTTLANAQNTISGKVRDNKGKPVLGASISIKDSYDGSTSDSSGRYRFGTSEKDSQTVVVTNVGYKAFEKRILLTPNTNLDVVLKEEVNELKAVTVTAGSFAAGGRKSAINLTPLDIVTTAGSNADIVAAFRSVPGTQQVGESEGLFVRGGTAQETKIFIDGNVVPNFFNSSVPDVAQRGRFSPFIFKGTSFSSGGYSATFGQALSAALILESIDLPDQSSASAGVAPLFLNGGFQILAKDKKSSYGMNYTYTDLSLYFSLVKQRPDFFQVPQYHALEGNFRIKLKNGGMLKYYGQFNAGNVGLRRPSLDSLGLKNTFALKNINTFHSFTLRMPLSNGWKLQSSLSYTYNKDQIGAEVQNQQNTKIATTNIAAIDFYGFDLTLNQHFLQLRGVLEKKLSGLNTIRFGAEGWLNEEGRGFANLTGTFNGQLQEKFVAAFGEADIFLTNEIAFKGGLRVEYSDLIKKWNIAPRAGFAYKFNSKAQMNLDYGIFYQTPETRYIGNNIDLGFTRADHYILTYQNLSTFYTFRTQVFYKDYVNLLKTGSGTGANASGTNGSGYAKGIELFWRDRKTIKGFEYWLSYSYLDTKRDFLNYPFQVQPTFAANHVASVVTKKFWEKISFGINLSYTYSNGRPFFNPNKPTAEFLSDRTQDFHNMNLSANWLTKIGKAFTVVVFSMNNVLNQDQVFSYNYSNRLRDAGGNLIRNEVSNVAPQFFFLGVFLSWGIDRRNEEVNKGL